MLTFDAPTHTYRFDGAVVPSVTQVLAGLHDFSRIDPAILDAARDRGTMVHLMCEHFDEDRLDRSEFTEDELSYLPGWERFMADFCCNWSSLEERVYHPLHRYAGTLDRWGHLEASDDPAAEWCIDVKSGELHPVWGLQTAAYAHAKGKPKARRATVQLRPDGTYHFREWKALDDFPTFVALLTVIRWTQRNP